MDQRILEARDLEGVLLIRDKLNFSAAFLIPHLLQLALAANLRGQYACVMITHEDVEDDAYWISWLRHSAQVCLAAGKHQLSSFAQGLVALLARPGPGWAGIDPTAS
ncbi:TPA: hypothetical protein ACH3X1_012916 [Trebouxia sp. C0004]